jgi:hypothetical protein
MFPHILAYGITPMIDWAEKFLDFKQKRKDMIVLYQLVSSWVSTTYPCAEHTA